MKSSISATGASPSVARPTRSFNVLLADGSRFRVTCRDLAAQLRQERTAVLRRLRQARAEALADVADRISEARIRREFEAAEREMDVAIRRLSKQVRIKPERPRASPSGRSPRARPVSTGHSGVTITRHTTSALARRDRLGREGMMLRIRYVRAGGRHASPGCLRRHYRYIGDTVDQVVGVLDLQEQVLRATRKNAKLGFRMVGAFPYGLPVDARRAILQRIGDEVLGERGLPWTAAAHDADPGASVDNPHFHLDYSLLPTELQADGSIVVSNDLRTDLDGQEGLRFIRHSVARVMTEVAREYGLDREFTALSYRERGMDCEGGEHVGQEGTAAHRRGEHVASIARNEARQRLAQARERARRARGRLDVLERLRRAITAAPAAPELASVPTGISEAEAVTLPPAPAVAEPDCMTDAGVTKPALRVATVDVGATLPIPPAEPDVGKGPQIGASIPEVTPYALTLVPGVARASSSAAAAVVVSPIGDTGAAIPTMHAVPTFAAPMPPAPVVDPASVCIGAGDGAGTHRDTPLTKVPPFIHDAEVRSAPIMPVAPSLILPPVAPTATHHTIENGTRIPASAPTVASTPMVGSLAAASKAITVPPQTIDLEAWAPPVARMESVPAVGAAGVSMAMMPSVPPLVASPPRAPAMAPVPASATMRAPSPPLDDHVVDIVIVASAAPESAAAPTLAIVAAAPEIVIGVAVRAIVGSEAPTTSIAPIDELPRNPAPRIAAIGLAGADTMGAPPIIDVPAAVAIGNPAPVVAMPPAITRIGSAIRVPTVAEPVIRRLRKAASSEAEERKTEQRIREVLEREEARRRDAAAHETGQQDITAALEALRRHDEWMRQDDDGLYTVSDAALRVTGLSRADIAIPEVQAALEAIGIEQVERLGPALDAPWEQSPLRVDDGTIRLNDRFDRSIREDVARWSWEPGFRAFVATVWPQLEDALASPPPQDRRERALTAMITAIAEERHSLSREGSLVVVPPHILARFGLSPADVAGDEARRRIANLADRQAIEISQIATHVQTSPHDIVSDGEGWRLRDTAPADIRLLVQAWRNDATMQQVLGRTVRARSAEAPIRNTVRPGAEESGDTSRIVRRFPGLPGYGMGD